MNINFDLPSFDEIDDKKNQKQIKNYLFNLTEQLKFTLSNLETDNFTDATMNEIIKQTQGVSGINDATRQELETKIKKLEDTIQTLNDTILSTGTQSILSTQYDTEITVTLPTEFQNKDFNVQAHIESMTNTGTNGICDMKCQVINKDTVAGTFKIKGYVKLTTGTYLDLVVSYLAVA